VEVLRAGPFKEVWVLPRRALPLVSAAVVVPFGSATDPTGKAGLAALTAEMMEQGSGERDARQMADAAMDLGADLGLSVDLDGSVASLSVTSDQLGPALQLLGAVVARPRFDAAEWKRVQPLWLGDLESRAAEPRDLARQVGMASLYGAAHPYGHMPEGTVTGVKALTLADLKAAHARIWQPQHAILVLSGDVDVERLPTLVDAAFGQWTAPKLPAPAPTAVPDPRPGWPRVVVADRPGAAQTVLAVLWPGPEAKDFIQLPAELVHIVLGGSFTSRLNQNLRERNGYTYGARSVVPFRRGAGPMGTWTSVEARVTGAALKETFAELLLLAEKGPTAAEVKKARATARGDQVEQWSSVEGAAQRLATLAALGLAAQRDRVAVVARDGLGMEEIQRAAALFQRGDALIVAVGDAATILPQLRDLGLPEAVRVDAEGRPL
jgi:predicted Zn-dependent peptidase